MRSTVAFRWEEDRELQEDAGAYLALFAKGVMPMKIPHCTTKYRLDFGMTADAEGHVDKVMRAVEKARELDHINDTQFALYEVRKAYELARTYKKRGDQAMQKRWKEEALRKAEGVEYISEPNFLTISSFSSILNFFFRNESILYATSLVCSKSLFTLPIARGLMWLVKISKDLIFSSGLLQSNLSSSPINPITSSTDKSIGCLVTG